LTRLCATTIILLTLSITGCSIENQSPPSEDVARLTNQAEESGEGSSPQDNESRTLASLRKIDEHPLYVMHYYGDYGFTGYLKKGTPSIYPPVPGSRVCGYEEACTVFSTLNENGNTIFGRNFDWHDHPALILFTTPPDGYASVSMVDISYLGYGTDDALWLDLDRLLRVPYLPFDGMNECGIAIGVMLVPHAEGGSDPSKVTIGDLEVVRLVLDYAGSVEEAVSLLRQYNVRFGTPLHYLISDRSGSSAVVEFVGSEVNVIWGEEKWQVSTNFLFSDDTTSGATSECWRYNAAYEILERANGNISQEEAMKLLEDVSWHSGTDISTQWSVVYNLTTGDIDVAMGRRFKQIYPFALR
jgi:hypothetical protein